MRCKTPTNEHAVFSPRSGFADRRPRPRVSQFDSVAVDIDPSRVGKLLLVGAARDSRLGTAVPDALAQGVAAVAMVGNDPSSAKRMICPAGRQALPAGGMPGSCLEQQPHRPREVRTLGRAPRQRRWHDLARRRSRSPPADSRLPPCGTDAWRCQVCCQTRHGCGQTLHGRSRPLASPFFWPHPPLCCGHECCCRPWAPCQG